VQGAADTHAGFVGVLDRRRPDRLTHGVGEIGQIGGLALDHRRDRGCRDLDAVKLVQELGDAILRQQLHRRQIGDHRREGRSVLDRPAHRLGEHRPRRRPAVRAAAFVGAITRNGRGSGRSKTWRA
jgi:hypothetical protein